MVEDALEARAADQMSCKVGVIWEGNLIWWFFHDLPHLEP